MKKLKKTEKAWQEHLEKERYSVLREKNTEKPFSGELLKNKQSGVYVCAGCGSELFSSEAKYDSGCGWPSFHSAISSKSIETAEDRSLLTTRIEVHCPRCDGHLGHVFEDGPWPTGKRYCINSASLTFKKDEKIYQ